jgi:hypothetical protein
MAKQSKFKMRVSGNVVEFWQFENPIFLEGNSSGGRRSKDSPESEKTDEYRKQNNRKSKDKFKSLVSTNFEDGDKFLTLTFRDSDTFNIKDVAETNKEFKKFMQRLKYKYGDFKYIGVIEFQDENKRGAVHYHLMCKLPYVPYEVLASIWGLGYIGINYIKGVDNIGAYLSKYMSKNVGDYRLKGKKNYLPSKNLDKPIIEYGNMAKELYYEYSKDEQKKEVFKDCYSSEHFGNITYKEYNLKRLSAQTKIGKGAKAIEQEKEYLTQIDSQIDSKKELTFVEQINEFIGDLENGKITYDKRILGEIERRERKDVLRRGNRDYLLKEFLECLRNGDERISISGKEEWREYSTGQEQWELFLSEHGE